MTAPRFVTDLYSDLRDRRLLPLVAILLVAIPALPVLLGSDDAPTVPAPEAGAAEGTLPSEPAVLVSSQSVRDYRDRLDELRSKNPFAGRFKAPSDDLAAATVGATIPVGGGGGGDVGSASATATDAVTQSAPASAAPTAATDTTNTSTATTETTSESSGGGGGGGGGGRDTPEVVAYRVDVDVGHAGDKERRRNVDLLSVLPSQSNPVLVFLGASEDGKEAVFMVADDVVRTHGDGDCVPTAADCQFLYLREGDERKLDYAPRDDPDTFVIRVVGIHLDPVKTDRSGDGGHDGGRDGARAGLKSFLGL